MISAPASRFFVRRILYERYRVVNRDFGCSFAGTRYIVRSPQMTGPELQKRRKALGLSQSGIAERLLVSPNTVARWERDEMAIPPYLSLALQTIERAVKKGLGAHDSAGLSQYLSRIMREEKLTVRDLAVMSIVRGEVENPTLRMIKALALGLQRPIAELLEAAGLYVESPNDGDIYISLLDSPRLSDLAGKYELLNPKEKQEVEPMVRQLENWIRSRLPPD